MVTKKCNYCNNEFTPIHKNHSYCSIKCRFWSKVDIKSKNECWNWNASLDSKKYGQFRLNGTEVRSHRLSFELTFGFFNSLLHVLHKCDNPKCCNPNHLYLGTHQDNMSDIINRKRAHKGYKLNIKDINSILNLLNTGTPEKQIAKIYNINQCTVNRIKNKKRWQRFI